MGLGATMRIHRHVTQKDGRGWWSLLPVLEPSPLDRTYADILEHSSHVTLEPPYECPAFGGCGFWTVTLWDGLDLIECWKVDHSEAWELALVVASTR